MLKFEKKIRTVLAYDRPSEKLLSFLNKYFWLNDYISQNNNYVVFDEFFDLISYSKNNITYDMTQIELLIDSMIMIIIEIWKIIKIMKLKKWFY